MANPNMLPAHDHILHAFPYQRDQYNILVVSDIKPYLTNLLQYCINTFGEFASAEQGIKLSDGKRLNIIDLSDGKFVTLVPEEVRNNIICGNAVPKWLDKFQLANWMPSWLKSHNVFNMLIPRTIARDKCKQECAYTLWLATSMDQIPAVLLTMNHILFMTSLDKLDELLKRKGRTTITYSLPNDVIVVATCGLNSNAETMLLSMARFVN